MYVCIYPSKIREMLEEIGVSIVLNIFVLKVFVRGLKDGNEIIELP